MNDKEKRMFLGLYQMLLADAEVHPTELELLYKIGKEKGGITEEEVQNAIFSPNTILSIDNLSDDERIEYLYNLSRIAIADGFVADKERETLQEASKLLGFAEENVKQIADFLLEQVQQNKGFEEVLHIIKNS